MPLRDLFHPPSNIRAAWDAVHGGWPMVTVQRLRDELPDAYSAHPRVHLAGDGAEMRGDEDENVSSNWMAPPPNLTFTSTCCATDEYGVDVFDRRTERVVAVIDWISPSNKQSTAARAQFVSKFLARLRRGVSILVVDVVTDHGANLYAELLDWIGARDPSLGEQPPATYAAACRWRPVGSKMMLEAWSTPLAVGDRLPVLPLWLTERLAVPVDLEASYEQTCRDLRIG